MKNLLLTSVLMVSAPAFAAKFECRGIQQRDYSKPYQAPTVGQTAEIVIADVTGDRLVFNSPESTCSGQYSPGGYEDMIALDTPLTPGGDPSNGKNCAFKTISMQRALFNERYQTQYRKGKVTGWAEIPGSRQKMFHEFECQYVP